MCSEVLAVAGRDDGRVGVHAVVTMTVDLVAIREQLQWQRDKRGECRRRFGARWWAT